MDEPELELEQPELGRSAAVRVSQTWRRRPHHQARQEDRACRW